MLAWSLGAASLRADPPPKNPPAAVSGDDQKIFDHKLYKLKFNQNALSDVIDFLRDVTGANIYVDWTALDSAGVARDTQVTGKFDGEKLSDVLTAVLNNAAGDPKKLSFKINDGLIFISTPTGVEAHEKFVAAHRKMAGANPSLAKKIPEIRFNTNALSDVIDFLRDSTGMKMTCDWDQLKRDGIEKDAPITMRLNDVTTNVAFEQLCESASNENGRLDFRVEGNNVTFFSLAAKTK